MTVADVIPRDGYKVFLRFNDGSEGVVDLSSLAGRGVFAAWLEPSHFRQVRVSASGGIEWPGELDLCPDALYLQMTGKSPEDLFPALRKDASHA